MRLAQAVRIGAWILVGLNLLMAIGTLTILARMAPAIAGIIERNERSLQACEDMLALLAETGRGGTFTGDQQRRFADALGRARGNVTEPGEPEPLGVIDSAKGALFAGSAAMREKTIDSILLLARINRDAVIIADHRAQQLGRTGSWGVAFMAMSVFLAGVIFIRSLTRRVVQPLEEIHRVIIAHRNGDSMRRCTGAELSQDVKAVYTGINEILDQCRVELATLPSFEPMLPDQDFSRPSERQPEPGTEDR